MKQIYWGFTNKKNMVKRNKRAFRLRILPYKAKKHTVNTDPKNSTFMDHNTGSYNNMLPEKYVSQKTHFKKEPISGFWLKNIANQSEPVISETIILKKRFFSINK